MDKELENQGKILVVDDNNETLSFLTKLLFDDGYIVYPADSGELALASYMSIKPDLILLDIQMAGISGFEVCKQIKADKEYELLPIIFLTSTGELDDKIEGLRLGAVDFILKPFHKEELQVKINNHIKSVRLAKLLKEQAVEIAESRAIQKMNEELQTKNEEYTILNKNYEILNQELLAKNNELSVFNLKYQESENRYKMLFDTMTEGVALNEIIYDEKGEMIDYRIVEVNKAFYNLGDYSNKQVIGNTARSLYGMPLQAIKVFWENHKTSTQPIFSEFQSPIGNEWFYISTSPIINHRFVTTFFNITKIKNAEIDIIEAKDRAERSEEKYRFLAENIQDVIWAMDVETLKFTYVSPSVEKLRGYTVEETISQSVMDALAPESKKYLAKVLPIRLEKIKNFPNKKHYYLDEVIQTCKDGSWVWTEVATYYIINSDNKVEIIGSSRNINERKKVEEELKKAKEHAEESDRLKTAFLQNMSHEIRTPMNAIMGFSELLVKNYNNKPKLEKFSEIISTRCNDLLELINDILDIAKIESGQLPLNMEVCDVSELFSEINIFFTEHQKRIGKQNIKFVMESSGKLHENTIITDKVKLKQILINLIGNAFKFTNNGTIECGCRIENNELVFFISDTGIGIPLEKQHYIFERFAQLNQGLNKATGGTGLGLSIVKGLVGILKGRIWLESELDRGTTFYFSIPYIHAQALQSEFFEAETQKEYNFNGKTILVVEDDIYNSEFLKEILSETGLNILQAVFGKEAVQIALSLPIDMVLMDIRLPDISGYEAIEQILKVKPQMKIIAQTAYATAMDKQNALDSGCLDYISKPVKRELLLTLLSKYI